MKKNRLYLFALVCYAVVSGLAMVKLFDSLQQNDKPKIMGAGLWLFISLVAFVSFLFLYRTKTKN
ncbi:MAG: hypothetical protein K2Y12_06390 [Chitinophagaceae bacterium]|nr:hypothetical protein [Chitinophagaceae bacterium]